MSLDVHVARRAMLQEDLVKLEKQIFDLEATYLEETAQTGNILRGWEG
jgi:chromatin modification-related protein EAF6